MMVIRCSKREVSLSGLPAELRDVALRIREVAHGGTPSVHFVADADADPAPYDQCLHGLIVHRGDGPTKVSVTAEGWLEAVGDTERLESFASYFDFADDTPPGYHVHHDPVWGEEWVAADSADLVIEARKTL